MHSLISISVIIQLSGVLSIPIDNGVQDEPIIGCSSDSTRLTVQTRNGFTGRLFVKGHSQDDGCFVDYTDQSSIPTNNANPRGVYLINTVVIQFHQYFLTKVDRAYRIQCFYMEADKTVTSALEVSMLSTETLNDQAPMPICQYTVHREDFDGPQARFFQIAESPFGMLVHSCYVSDGANEQILLVDENGCSMDPYILGHLSYSPDLLTAFREAHVFKFADKTELNFQCQIRLCHKSMGTCNGMTPPKCQELINRRKRRRKLRSANSESITALGVQGALNETQTSTEPEFDVLTNTLIILDPDEFLVGTERFENINHIDLSDHTDGSYCVTRNTFQAGLYLSVVWVLCVLVATALFARQRYQATRTVDLHKIRMYS